MTINNKFTLLHSRKAIISLAEGTENNITDGETYVFEDESSTVFFIINGKECPIRFMSTDGEMCLIDIAAFNEIVSLYNESAPDKVDSFSSKVMMEEEKCES